jgi:hypothetical protein
VAAFLSFWKELDLELWVNRIEENCKRLARALRDFGYDVSEDTLRPFWQKDRRMITLGAKPQAIDLLNFLAEDRFSYAWAGRTETTIEGVALPVIGLREFVRSKRTADRQARVFRTLSTADSVSAGNSVR